MPTEIKIVLPATDDDDAISINDDVECNNSDKNNSKPYSEFSDKQKHCITKNGNSDCASPNHSPRRRNQVSRRPQSSRVHSRTTRSPLQQQQQQPSAKHQKLTQHSKVCKTTLQQKQHHLSEGQATQRYIILGESPCSSRPSTVSGERDKKKQSRPAVKSQGDGRISVTDTYDLDLEHRDIMVKALQSYTQYSRNDESGDPKIRDNRRISNRVNQRLLSAQNKSTTGNKDRDRNGGNQSPVANKSLIGCDQGNNCLPDSPRQFHLSRCRLRFHDDEEPEKTVSSSKRRSKSRSAASPTVAAMTTLYTLDEGDGVLVDSVGHVYRPQRNRPWSALPGKFTEQVKMSKWRLCQSSERRSDDYASIDSTSTSEKGDTNSINSNSNPVKAVTLRHKAKMSQPISHSRAYQRRNQTTHSWYDTSHLMSQSMPNASFLHRQYVGGSSASTPRSSRDATSEKASPAGKPTMSRPSSSYSYDGGFFVGAHAGQADYFVIHPDWVSESMTIKKLSIGDKNNGPPVSPSARFNKSRYQSRRCMSAPPSKQRNPITWEPSNPIDIPNK